MLTLEEVIIESDDDLAIWSSIVVGFDISKNLVIRLEHIDYEAHENDYTLAAAIEKDDAFRMACFLHVKLTYLPRFLFEKFGTNFPLSVPSEVERLFKSMLDFVLDCGEHYKLKRQKTGS